jgi:hypothetical protein
MDKYDKKLLNLVGKVADRISENAMILIVSVSFVIAAFLA